MPELVAGAAIALSPRVTRVLAPNPGFMTGPGTNSYLIGRGDLAVLDPGPALSAHVEALLAAAAALGGRIRWIVLTHTHQDHAPAALELQRRTGAPILGQPPLAGDPAQATLHVDQTLAHGERLVADGFTLRALHTPGHVGNHLCYLLEDEQMLFSGDHLINGSTVVIVPPSGNMADYIRSLELLSRETIHSIAPGHGDTIANALALIQYTIHHRLAREAKVLSRLAPSSRAIAALTPLVYDDVSPSLHAVAQYSLHAHLIKLREEGKVVEDADGWRLA
ncbi:MAG TPA: MBL fold metallo-hydrolase [Moraxellaceae bacterium]|nr:MBL fold metallo-hydrolase [Moraxellaceae bacterium]